MMKNKLITLLTIFALIIPVNAKELIPGGESCGVSLKYDGVLITGSYAFFDETKDRYLNENKFSKNDLITKCNNITINNSNHLIEIIKEQLLENNLIEVEVINSNTIRKEILDVYFDTSTNTFKTGLYISDESTAIGTITYYDPQTNTFGAFGHNIDVDNECLDFNASELFYADITSIEQNTSQASGKKIGIIDKTMKIGDVRLNHVLGVYGTYEKIYKDDITTLPTATPNIGKALIYTTLDDNQTKAYEIYIHKITNNKYKSIEIEIIDPNLLIKTNGIIPGMSGSPIIQNGKLVGAVTHVLVNNPTRGYGIFIDNMLDAEKL